MFYITSNIFSRSQRAALGFSSAHSHDFAGSCPPTSPLLPTRTTKNLWILYVYLGRYKKFWKAQQMLLQLTPQVKHSNPYGRE